MKSLLEGLPPEVAQRIHPDWQRNETEYWAVRDTLLQQYRDQWIAFANGRVLVSGASAVEVLHTAQASGLHPFVICVGREHEPARMRRAVFAYDTTYPHEALPVLPVEFRTTRRPQGWGTSRSSPILEPMRVRCRGRIVPSWRSIPALGSRG